VVIALAVSRERCVFHVDPHVDVHKGEGVWLMWTDGGGSKIRFFCGRHKWMQGPIFDCTYVVQYTIVRCIAWAFGLLDASAWMPS